MKKTQVSSTMDVKQLQETNGGGIAYDIGRLLRFIGLAAPGGANLVYAVTDWEVTTELNEV